ncbi:xanthine dehydrogenase accessory factor [Candidatus Pantoea symbiotica]|uniref:Xanthine dehydrogenase accessory factor n=1 Tax=Candidatus Pantoea symbiotica TaxID=1884370 RepID=A0A1I4EBN8_9GAMM|nr:MULTISPECIES: XdhC family protein [Pantoea]SFL03155.1 xanthine dehydrogenase accessory factor [Pantoea symbiotica]SFV07931.1 xanthine dehydrogenase accessory factor [Pantoea sp. YR525]
MQQLLIDEDLQPQINPQQALQTDDSETILRFALEAMKADFAAVLITLVEIRGGAARALGAQMVVREDGRYCGYVSGGCVEAAAAYEALQVIASGKDRVVRYGEGSPYLDIVLPCGGGIALAFHRLRDAQPLKNVLDLLANRQPAALRYLPKFQRLARVDCAETTGWQDDAFVIGYLPKTRVAVYGRSVEALATASIAQAAGYEVLSGEDVQAQAIDPFTAVILLYHDLDRELPVLLAALRSTPFYIGALGSQRTHATRVEKLLSLGFSEDEIARIKAPIGIFAQARDARTLALSIVADVAAARLNVV